MDPYIGEIRCFGFNFAPLNWAFCNGEILAISQNTALFAVLGTIYGGDGRVTFALPDLRGQSPMHWGSSPTGFITVAGETLGNAAVTLTANQIPQHRHTIYATSIQQGGDPERSPGPNQNGQSYLSQANASLIYEGPPSTPDTNFSDTAISISGDSQPHENMQPYLAMNFCISLYGVFPSRN